MSDSQANADAESDRGKGSTVDLRRDFPIVTRFERDGLTYLDNAATSQMPRSVLDAMTEFVETKYGAVHRGVGDDLDESTAEFELARARIAAHFGAGSDEVVFTQNATGAANLLAGAIQMAGTGIGARRRSLRLGPGDRILLTEAEHHSNIVPWLDLAARFELEVDWLPVAPNGSLRLECLDSLCTEQTRVVAFTHGSNVTGMMTDVAAVVERAHDVGALAVLDAAQTGATRLRNFKESGVDFALVSAHKMCGPTGVGALLGRSERLACLAPVGGGGGSVRLVTKSRIGHVPVPHRFESGTPPVVQTIGWAAAVDYLSARASDIAQHETRLTAQLLDGLTSFKELQLLTKSENCDRLPIISFACSDGSASDVASALSASGFRIRFGQHCAQPLHRALNVSSSIRVSIGPLNSEHDIASFTANLARAIKLTSP